MNNLKNIIKELKFNRLSDEEKYLYNIFIDLKYIIDSDNFILYQLNDNTIFKYDNTQNIMWCNGNIFKNYFYLYNDNKQNFLLLNKYINIYLNIWNMKVLTIPESILNKKQM